MSELGESVITAIKFLDRFNRDLSKLVSTVEDGLRHEKFLPMWNSSGSVWDRSAAYNSPTGWTVRYLFRAYAYPPADATPPDTKAQTRWGFFVAYLTPKRVAEPIAVWGTASLPAPGDPWPPMKQLLARDDGPSFVQTECVDQWTDTSDNIQPLVSLTYQVCPIVMLKDSSTVEKTVVMPLIERLGSPP